MEKDLTSREIREIFVKRRNSYGAIKLQLLALKRGMVAEHARQINLMEMLIHSNNLNMDEFDSFIDLIDSAVTVKAETKKILKEAQSIFMDEAIKLVQALGVDSALLEVSHDQL